MNGKELIQELEKRDKGVPILIEIENKLYKINAVQSEGTCISIQCEKL